MTTFNFNAEIDLDVETTDGTSVLSAGYGSAIAVSLTRFIPINRGSPLITSETNNRYIIPFSCTLSGMWVYVIANTISATSFVRLRKNGADGNQSISITASTTGAFEDTTNSDSITSSDYVNYSVVTGGTGTSITLGPISIVVTNSTEENTFTWLHNV